MLTIADGCPSSYDRPTITCSLSSILIFSGSRGKIFLDDYCLHDNVDAEAFDRSKELNIKPPDGEVVHFFHDIAFYYIFSEILKSFRAAVKETSLPYAKLLKNFTLYIFILWNVISALQRCFHF